MTRIVACEHCGQSYDLKGELADESVFRIGCTGCYNVFEALVSNSADQAIEADGDEVLIGHAVDTVFELLADTVRKLGFRVIRANDGERAWRVIQSRAPKAIILDVALRDFYVFELVEKLRKSEHGKTPVVLIASVFRSSRYKRKPQSLYGADGYVEQHHVTDKLPEILGELLSDLPMGTERALSESEKLALEDADRGAVDDIERASKIAWRIVTDIALYYEKELAAGGEDLSAKDLLDQHLDEGRALLKRSVSEDVFGQKDFVLEAFEELWRSRQGRVG